MNTDKLQTLMGAGESLLVGIMTYVATMIPDGPEWKSTVLMVLGSLLAASRGIKGYFAAGVKKAEVPA